MAQSATQSGDMYLWKRSRVFMINAFAAICIGTAESRRPLILCTQARRRQQQRQNDPFYQVSFWCCFGVWYFWRFLFESDKKITVLKIVSQLSSQPLSIYFRWREILDLLLQRMCRDADRPLKCLRCAWEEPEAAVYSCAGLFQSLTHLKPSVYVSALTPQALLGWCMRGQECQQWMNTLNHYKLVQIGLMRTIWTTVSQGSSSDEWHSFPY